MLRNYILMTLRTFARHKISSLIAILSLALGLSASMLLYTYIDYHRSFEDFMPEDSHVKRLVLGRLNHNGIKRFSGEQTLSPYAARLLAENVSSIKETATIYEVGERLFHNNDSLNRENFYSVSSEFFNLVPLPLIEGNRGTLLSAPNEIVINTLFAEKYFPDETALGKEITFHDDENHYLTISGVVHIPRNSHLYKDEAQIFLWDKFIIDNLNQETLDPRSDKRVAIYCTNEKNLDKSLLKNELSAFTRSLPQYKESRKEELILEDIQDIHLFSKVNGTDANNPLFMVIFLGALTVGLLAISVINCLLILTALSITRTKEVGIRLVMGGNRKDLIFQFLAESITLSFISFILALVLVELLQSAFSNLTQLDLSYSYSAPFFLFTVILTIIVGILSGILPAFYLASLLPVESLKGNKFIKLRRSKKMLLIAQFLFASIILIWALTVNNELNYVKNMDIGFDNRDLVSVYPGRWGFGEENYEKITRLKEELQQIEGVENVAHTSWVPMLGGYLEENIYLSEDGVTHYQEFYSYIDKDYIETLSIPILEGSVEKNSVIAMKNTSEYRNLRIGDQIELGGNRYRVSAIMGNYYLQTALNGYENIFHIVSEDSFQYQIIKSDKDIDIKKVKKLWKSIFPHYYLVEFRELTDIVYEQNFPQIARTIIKVINVVMIVTLFISASGLFGLTLQSVKEKTKEIGIRRVLGAGFNNILGHFFRDFATLIIIAIIIGIPLGIISIKKGLFSLGYRLPIHNLLGISILTATIILSAGTLLIGTMVIKSARANPASALRYE